MLVILRTVWSASYPPTVANSALRSPVAASSTCSHGSYISPCNSTCLGITGAHMEPGDYSMIPQPECRCSVEELDCVRLNPLSRPPQAAVDGSLDTVSFLGVEMGFSWSKGGCRF